MQLNKTDENWLLSSVKKAWQVARHNASKGNIWTERDLICLFYGGMRELVEQRVDNPINTLGDMRLYTEVIIYPKNPKYRGENRKLDLILAQVSSAKIPQPKAIIAALEFKFAWDYGRANIEKKVRKDIWKLSDGNEDWTIWGIDKHSARTDYVFFGLVADNWKEHIHGSAINPYQDGILHPNGVAYYSKKGLNENPVPSISDKKAWLNYFELHGPFSVKQDEDYILSDDCKWLLFRIDNSGKRHDV